MKKRNLFDGGFTTKTDYRGKALLAARELPKLNFDLDQPEYTRLLRGAMSYKDTPIGQTYGLIINSPSTELLHMSFLSTTERVPDILQLSQLSICGEELAHSLAHTKYGRVWNPITTGIKRVKGDYEIASMNILIENTVRSQLSSNFFRCSKPWLKPEDVIFVSQIYGQFMAMVIARKFSLTIQEELPLVYIFAWYYMLLCGVPTDKDGVVPLCDRVGKNIGLLGTSMEKISASLSNMYMDAKQEPTLKELLTVVHEFSPDRVSYLKNETTIYSMMLGTSTNGISIAIGVDYPPYFMAFLLSTVSIGQHGFLSRVLKERNKPSVIGTYLRNMCRSGYFHV